MRAEFRPYRLVIVYTKYGLYCTLVCTNMLWLIAIEVISFMYHLGDPRNPFLTGNCGANANTAFQNKQTETAKKQLPVTTHLVSNDNLTTVLSGLECSSWIWTFTSYRYMDLCPITLRVKRFLVSDSGFCLWFWFLISGSSFWSLVSGFYLWFWFLLSGFWSLGLVLVRHFWSVISGLWFYFLVSGSAFCLCFLISGFWF